MRPRSQPACEYVLFLGLRVAVASLLANRSSALIPPVTSQLCPAVCPSPSPTNVLQLLSAGVFLHVTGQQPGRASDCCRASCHGTRAAVRLHTLHTLPACSDARTA